MSIAHQEKIEQSEKKTFLSGRHFKEMIGKTTANIAAKSPDVITVFVIMITAVKELSGAEFSVPWLVILFSFLVFYFIKNLKCSLQKNADEK